MNKQLPRRPFRFVGHYTNERLSIIKQFQRRPVKFVRHYLNELSYYISEKTILRLKIIGQFLGIILLTAFFGFIFLTNSVPFGATKQYAMGQDTTDISQLGPTERAQTVTIDGQNVTKITDDLVYFTTAMPFNFDSATVKIWYKNQDPNQIFSVGFQDKNGWHYATKTFDVPFLDTLQWNRIGTNLNLYQQVKTYNSVDSFLKNPPHNAIIGTYNYNTNLTDTFQTQLQNYQPASSSSQTTISSPLRGKQTLYVYLDHEPLNLSFEKQDLNWYKGPDPVTVNVYQGNNLVYQVTAPDDGITDASKKILPPKTVIVNNPGPGLPETGTYKIVINANDDTIINNIQTNLHKIVFGGSLFLAGNSTAYPGAVASTSATTIYTNALSLSALTYHNAGDQQIIAGNQILTISNPQIQQTITPPDDITPIIVPKNDVILNAFEGYFAFLPDQFFSPTTYYTLPITKNDDVKLTNYILTSYSPPQKENGWEINEQTFDLHSAYNQNNKLSWIIESPHLKEKMNPILIKDIQITFHKNGWL